MAAALDFTGKRAQSDYGGGRQGETTIANRKEEKNILLTPFLSAEKSKRVSLPKAGLGLKSEHDQIFLGVNLNRQPPRPVTGNLRELFNLPN